MQTPARKHTSESRPHDRPRIALAVATTWFALGCVALMLMPGVRGDDPWLGWLPFWLVGVPAIEWALLRLCYHDFAASPVAARGRMRRAATARSTPSRRLRAPAAPARRARAATLLTALFVRPV